MHIPKTGGSGIRDLSLKLVERGQPFPCCFPHGWTLAAIAKRYPRMRVTLILRDPLERTISGFNSRLRQGRPTYKSLWKPAEAIAFAHFPDVRRYLDALLADDDWSLSACAYANRHVRHLHWNYRYYFRNPEAVRANADRIALVGHIEQADAFVDALLAEAGIPAASAAGLYGSRRHEAQIGLRRCSPATARATSRRCAPGSPTSTRSTTRSSPSGASQMPSMRRLPEPGR